MLQHVRSQEEMNLAAKDLDETLAYSFPLNTKTLFYNVRFKFFNLWWRYLFGFPLDYNPWRPGLEAKYALEEATKLNSKVVFLGPEFDKNTLSRMYHETRYSILKTLHRSIFKLNVKYGDEFAELHQQLHSYGLQKFVESSCDQYFINW
jgi:hypothetical protein